MTDKEKLKAGFLFDANYNPTFEVDIAACKEKCYDFNMLRPKDKKAQHEILKSLLGSMGESVTFTAPFWCDYGYNITVGDYFYANHNLIITDGATVTFGNHVFIAPNCCFTTAEHAIDATQRNMGLEVAKPITVGNSVWIGAGSTILAGVSIGDNTIIGAGSVVTKSIPSNVIAVGVPCSVMREITEQDKYRYPILEEDLTNFVK